VTPFEVIKIRLQNQTGTDKVLLKYQGPVDAVVKTVKNEVGRRKKGRVGEASKAHGGNVDKNTRNTHLSFPPSFPLLYQGILALWNGATPTVFRNGLNQATMFWCKNAVDEMLWHKHEGDEKQLQIWQSMASGFIATCPGMVLTNPFDIAKVREQVGVFLTFPVHSSL
jgi:solute carrier family 25 citrate transporter 1